MGLGSLAVQLSLLVGFPVDHQSTADGAEVPHFLLRVCGLWLMRVSVLKSAAAERLVNSVGPHSLFGTALVSPFLP